MTYQVLARKYRPASFEELEGQEHVLRALVNALTEDRLHHAYLFTGTRGVGKTTIARILAKCLNCEAGVTAKPCGKCSSCVEIAEGRSVDLIEVDAASRTRVEDTRELLDNVQYMPTRSRYKVYLIDEVHMLSNHSFNALLKTLEEPPPHVKFLLATTDPKKLPVTVLSRCLQFNLKNLSPERVVTYLRQILQREEIEFEDEALWHLGRAANGSMRDALSLADQAISYGNYRLTEADVRAMLGAIDQREVYEILEALVARDASRLLGQVARLAEFGPDFEMLLAELLRVLHRIAIAQVVPDSVDNSQGDRELVLAAAKSLGREEVQLYYQIGLMGQRDLPLAPDPREGFEMVMLRMLSFAPDRWLEDDSAQGTETTGSVPPTGEGQRANPIADILSSINQDKQGDRAKAKPAPPPVDAAAKPVSQAPVAPASASAPDDASDEIPWDDTTGVAESATVVDVKPAQASAEPDNRVEGDSQSASLPDPGDWDRLFGELDLSGVTRALASNCVMGSIDDEQVVLLLREQHASLWNASHEARIAQALTKRLGREMRLTIEIRDTDGETPAQAQERRDDEERAKAIDAISNDGNVKQIIEAFDGKLNMGSIMPRSQAER